MGEYLFTASAAFSLVNGALLLSVNPRRTVNQVFFLSSVWIALWFGCVVLAIREGKQPVVDESSLRFWIQTSSAVAAFSIWNIWLMKFSLQEGHTTLRRTLASSWRWLGLAGLLAILAYTDFFVSTPLLLDIRGRGLGYNIYVVVLTAAVLGLMFAAVRDLRRLRGIRRLEMQFCVIGGAGACSLVLISTAIGRALDLKWLLYSSPVWFSALHGAVVWAACSHKIFEAKQIVASAGQRLLLLIAIAVLAAVVHHSLAPWLSNAQSIVFVVISACSIILFCDDRIRNWAGLSPAARIDIPRSKIIDWARTVPTDTELEVRFAELLRELCGTDTVVLLAQRSGAYSNSEITLPNHWLGLTPILKESWITPEALQRLRPTEENEQCLKLMTRETLGALITAPRGSANPSLIVGLGLKESLRPYTFPDVKVLLELAELMDNILTHSRAGANLAKLERIESATMISRGLAHDLKGLATPVSAFLIHMENRVSQGTIEETVLNDAKASLRVMQDYIEDSLYFAQKFVLRFSRIDSHLLLASIAEIAKKPAKLRNVHVVVVPESRFSFFADATLLRRMLQNLVLNGIDASEPGGSVALSATITGDNLVSLLVSDQGQGIPATMRDRIFEPYFTTKTHRPEGRRGIGLGLSICQRIAELHGGTIAVSANVPHGTVFTVSFPIRHKPLLSATDDQANAAIAEWKALART